MFLLDPIFLFHTNLGVMGAALATVLSEAIPMLVLFILFYLGKFTVKPKLSELFKPFRPDHGRTLLIGLSACISILSMNIPSIFMNYFTGQAVNTPASYAFLTTIQYFLLGKQTLGKCKPFNLYKFSVDFLTTF